MKDDSSRKRQFSPAYRLAQLEREDMDRNNERKRLYRQQIAQRWNHLIFSIIEAETKQFVEIGRQLVEAGHLREAQSACYDRMAIRAKEYPLLLVPVGRSNPDDPR